MDILELKTSIRDPLSQDDSLFIRDQSEDLLKYGDVSECRDLATYIGEILQNYAQALQSKPQIYDMYQTYWHRLAFKAFTSLPNSVKTDLLQRRFLFAISKGFEPDDLVQKYFDLFDDDKDTVKNALSNYIKILEQNTETFGTGSLTIEDKKYLPQIRYWILDYTKFPSMNAKRTSLDRLNYVNQSANAKGLTQGQRQVLLKVLKFYDNLSNPEPVVISTRLPETQSFAGYQQPAEPKPLAASAQQTQVNPALRPQQQVPQAPAPISRPVPATPAASAMRPPATASTPLSSNPKIDISQKLEDLKNRVK